MVTDKEIEAAVKAFFNHKEVKYAKDGEIQQISRPHDIFKAALEAAEKVREEGFVRIPKGLIKIGTGYVNVEQRGDRASLEVTFRNLDELDDRATRRECFLFPATNPK